MALGALLAILAWTATSICALASPDQQVLSFETNQTGFLRRFSTSDSRSTDELLQLAQKYELDVWQVAASHVDIYSPPHAPFLPFPLVNLPHSKTNISVPLTQTRVVGSAVNWNLTTLENSTFHAEYHPLYEIDEFITQLAASYPNEARIVRLGHTGEGREMLGLTLSRSTTKSKRTDNNRNELKPKAHKMGFVITGAQHAREWVATATALYLAHAIVANASEPHSLSHLLDFFDFYIIPSPNPDGYSYTWEADRFWYKNRMIVGPTAKCVGLDMNRNWGYKWKREAVGEIASTDYTELRPKTPTDPCSHWYPGRRPFEAPEVNNIANYINTLPNLVAFVDLRSYGQMLTSPYSYSCKRVPKDAEDLLEAALGGAHAISLAHGTSFMTGSLCSLLYRAPGNIVDWMYARAGIKYSYAAHLRDTGTYGFALPAEWIRPVGEEMRNMVDYVAKFIIKHHK